MINQLQVTKKMVGTKGCSGGWRAGAGRRPDTTTIKKKGKSTKPNEKQSNEKQSAFFKDWHSKMIDAGGGEKGSATCGGCGSQGQPASLIVPSAAHLSHTRCFSTPPCDLGKSV